MQACNRHLVSPTRTRTTGGFTLFEVMVAALVIAVALMGLAASMALAARHDMSTLETTEALNAARTEIEVLRATPFGALAARNDTGFTVYGLRGQGPAGRIAVKSLSTSLADATVTVSWRGVFGDRSITLHTLIANQ